MKIDLQRINFAATPPPQFKEAKGAEWYTYGLKNDFPQEILNLYNSSALHNAIVTQKAQFIAGKDTTVTLAGTIGEQAGAAKALQYANPYESWHDLKLKCATDLENFGGYALQGIWNVPGTKIVAWYHLPFDKCRVNQDASKIWYSDNWHDRKVDKKEFPAFNPSQPGGTQVFWFKQYRAGEGIYPLPDWYPARTYIEIDTQIADFHFNNIKNGFSLGKIIQMFKGEPTEDIKEEFDRKFKRNTTGTDNANGVLISWNDKGEEPMRVESLMPADFDKQYLQLAETVRDNIFYAHRVTSPMLFGVRVAGELGGRNELLQAYEVFDRAYVAPKRKQMERVFTQLFQAMGYAGEIISVPSEPAAQDALALFSSGIIDRAEARASFGYSNEQTVQMSAENPFGWDDERDIQAFSEYGKSADEYEELPELFAELTSPEMRLIAVIKDNPKATLEELAKGARLTTDEAAKVLKNMQANGLIEWDNKAVKITESGVKSIADSGGLETEVFVLYQYAKNPEISGPTILPNGRTREFCQFMVEQNKLYTREEIDTISQRLGYDVWKRRGGWRTIAGTTTHVPHCRHIWQSKLYRRRVK
jgi:predicted transcriptional regulator